ncbi:MAG: NTP transferase domain-containing protein [Lutibacter sp.]|nr:NTP transferase domain-containing protein [Lutibacter sp.]MDT8417120.1 NTP transferase domain-containing protein [Lutibacter sp.]
MENKTIFVLLAGGKSERMGVDKGLLKYKHTFWILEQLNRISKTSIKTVYIGLGYNSQHYFNTISWLKDSLNNDIEYQGLKIKTIVNPAPEFGSFSTLQSVLKNINSSCDVLVNPVDVPLLNTDELNKIIAAKNNIVMPNFEEKNGHPIKMVATFWQNLISLNFSEENSRLDLQLKKVNTEEISIIKVNDASVIKNLNTKTAWISYLNEAEN